MKVNAILWSISKPFFFKAELKVNGINYLIPFQISKHYETLIEDLEGHRNHGHCMEDESVIDNGNPVTDHQQIPGSIGTCDQTYGKPDSPGSKQVRCSIESSYID